MKIGTFDALIGEQIERDATAEEISAREAEVAQWLIEKKAQEEAAAQARTTKINAYEKLGLTPDEIEALLPTPKPLTR